MHDPLKDFVKEHRSAFDSELPPPLDLAKVMPVGQKVKAKQKKLPFQYLGWAACFVALVGTTWWISQNNLKKTEEVYKQVTTKKLEQPAKIAPAVPEVKTPVQEIASVVSKPKVPLPTNVKRVQLNQIMEMLVDSSSASRRLLGILEIERIGILNERMAMRLEEVMLNDGNTNVRLAALSILQMHQASGFVNDMLIASLSKQNDPMVQLGLVATLGQQAKDKRVTDQLIKLVVGPETFAAVRDEAYSILLNNDLL